MLPADFIFACPKIAPYLYESFRNDMILSDNLVEYFSVDPLNQCTEGNQTKFELCSDRLAKNLPNYVFDERGRVRPGPETSTVNFDYLKELLLSKDRDEEASFHWEN